MTTPNDRTARTVILAIVILFSVTLVAVTLLTLFTKDPESNTALVASLFGNLGAIAAVLVNLQRTASVEEKVDTVGQQTSDLVNGLLDAKVRAGVADVMHPDLIDPDAHAQLHADRAKRTAYDDAHPTDEGNTE